MIVRLLLARVCCVYICVYLCIMAYWFIGRKTQGALSILSGGIVPDAAKNSSDVEQPEWVRRQEDDEDELEVRGHDTNHGVEMVRDERVQDALVYIFPSS